MRSDARNIIVFALCAIPLLYGCAPQESGTSSSGACESPMTVVTPATVTPGQHVTVSAADMWDGCNDQGYTSELPAFTDQPVTWTQNGRSVLLARADADPRSGRLAVKVTVPATAVPGRAEVTAGIAVPAAVDVVASRRRGTP